MLGLEVFPAVTEIPALPVWLALSVSVTLWVLSQCATGLLLLIQPSSSASDSGSHPSLSAGSSLVIYMLVLRLVYEHFAGQR